jgi:hypothetical protein
MLAGMWSSVPSLQVKSAIFGTKMPKIDLSITDHPLVDVDDGHFCGLVGELVKRLGLYPVPAPISRTRSSGPVVELVEHHGDDSAAEGTAPVGAGV